MNLIEAILSGRPIRRCGRSSWSRAEWVLGHGVQSTFYICDPDGDDWLDPHFYLATIGPDKEDILADDWEIRSDKS